eukprot:ANDGO_01593.mRNA.1 DNA-directed primase/polymerase protein OS=Danio rerio GN=primpol PE=2 SV=2
MAVWSMEHATTMDSQGRKQLKSLSKSFFYGKKSDSIGADDEPAWRKFLRKVEDRAKQRRLSGRAVWTEFGKQEEALLYARHHEAGAHLRLWAYELSSAGRRKYVVASVDSFFDRYYELLEEERNTAVAGRDGAVCYNEVIREADVCHLYFDVEYMLEDSPDRDGEHMVQVLIDLFLEGAQRLMAVQCTTLESTRAKIVCLDACTSHKFSKHLVVPFADAVWKNNLHVGQFVFAMLDELQGRREFDPRINVLFVKKKDVDDDGNVSKKEVPCIDVGVYTRNRCFRLYRSSKFAKHNPFLYRKSSELGSISAEKCKFKNSLVVADLSLYNPASLRILEWTLDAKSASSSGSKYPLGTCLWRQNGSGCPSLERDAPVAEGSLTTFPFPSVRFFLEQLFTKVSQPNLHPLFEEWQSFAGFPIPDFYTRHEPLQMRKWQIIDSSAQILTVSTIGNKYCENIGRQHKSNTQYYLIDLKSGTFYQKCFDPDCRYADYRSSPKPILPSFRPLPFEIEGVFMDVILQQDDTSVDALLRDVGAPGQSPSCVLPLLCDEAHTTTPGVDEEAAFEAALFEAACREEASH